MNRKLTQGTEVEKSTDLARRRSVLRAAERELARGPASTCETRQWLRATCTGFGFDPVTIDAAVLVGSELLANAFLHASGPYSVMVEVETDLVRVGVRDRSLTHPLMKAFDELAATGRGLQIVAATAIAWGCDPHVDGKTVWAEVTLSEAESPWPEGGVSAQASERDVLQPGQASRTISTASGALEEMERTASRSGREAEPGALDEVVRVSFLGVPVQEFIAMRARIESMLRESTLIVLGGSGDELPGELATLAWRATAELVDVARAEAAASTEPVRLGAEGRGDFVVGFPRRAALQLRQFGEIVRKLNKFCESSELLVTPLTTEMLELHAWSSEEARRQIEEGRAPQPLGC